MSTYLSRDQILAASDSRYEDVHVPEWGGTVRVRGLTASQRDAFEMAAVKQKGASIRFERRDFRARLLVLTIVDEEGNPLFSQRDVELLGDKSAAAADRVYDVAARLSGLGASDEDELLGNDESGSGEIPGAGSLSD